MFSLTSPFVCKIQKTTFHKKPFTENDMKIWFAGEFDFNTIQESYCCQTSRIVVLLNDKKKSLLKGGSRIL